MCRITRQFRWIIATGILCLPLLMIPPSTMGEVILRGALRTADGVIVSLPFMAMIGGYPANADTAAVAIVTPNALPERLIQTQQGERKQIGVRMNGSRMIIDLNIVQYLIPMDVVNEAPIKTVSLMYETGISGPGIGGGGFDPFLTPYAKAILGGDRYTEMPHLAEIVEHDDQHIAVRLWRLSGLTVEQAIAREQVGMQEVRRMRQLDDKAAQCHMFEQIVSETRTPSVALVSEADRLVCSPIDDASREVLLRGLAVLMFRDDAPRDVQMHAFNVHRVLNVLHQEQVAPEQSRVLIQTIELFEKAAENPGEDPHYEFTLLRAIEHGTRRYLDAGGPLDALGPFQQTLQQYARVLQERNLDLPSNHSALIQTMDRMLRQH